MKTWKGKTVTVLGAARSGQAAARLLHESGAHVQISENAGKEKIDPAFVRWVEEKDIGAEWTGHSPKMLQSAAAVILSPGVPLDCQPVRWAVEKKIPVISEIELAARSCSRPIIAVTGSNGKTTVVTLLRDVLMSAGKKVCLCGNVGLPFCDFVAESRQADYVVLEVSSFQLQTIDTFHPHVAVFLNFSENHLDHHRDIEEYFAAKKRIFMNQNHQDYAVLNADDQYTAQLIKEIKARVLLFPGRKYPMNSDSSPGQGANPNYQAVLTAARALGISPAICRDVFHSFRGVEHRMEKVRTIEDIDFINDAKATTTEAGRWALEQINRPIVMICGGRDKNLDFSSLRELVKEKVKAMIVFGEAGDKLKSTFSPVVAVEQCRQLEDAVLEARGRAAAGDCILLSPMCASFDMFKNYEERGQAFKEIVRKLK